MDMFIMKRLDTALQNRRAIKYFEPSFAIPEIDLGYILSSALELDLGFKESPLRICRVNDKRLRQQISEVGFNQPQHTQASELWVFCIDTGKLCGQEDIRKQAMLAGAAYSQAVMLATACLGYDSCPMIGFQFDKVAELIGLPDDYVLTNFVVLGKRQQSPLPRGSKLVLDDVLSVDEFA